MLVIGLCTILLCSCNLGLTEKPGKDPLPGDTDGDTPIDSGYHPIDTGDHDDTNHRPVADAGDDREVALDVVVELDGSGSTDPDGDPLTYSWTMPSTPSGSSAFILNADRVSASFMPDVVGEYVVELVVNDGTMQSQADAATVVAIRRNGVPTAEAGFGQAVTVGSVVRLDGSRSSDPDGDALSYAWTLSRKPGGSTAVLVGGTTVSPSFTADAAGEYLVELVVSDGTASSPPDTVTITAEEESSGGGGLCGLASRRPGAVSLSLGLVLIPSTLRRRRQNRGR